MPRLIFRVKSPLGYDTVLTRDRWRQIVRFKRPSVEGHQRLVRQCVEQPEAIRESTTEPEVHLYYSTTRRGQLCVLVAPGETVDRFVVTAYFTRNIKAGRELWKK